MSTTERLIVFINASHLERRPFFINKKIHTEIGGSRHHASVPRRVRAPACGHLRRGGRARVHTHSYTAGATRQTPERPAFSRAARLSARRPRRAISSTSDCNVHPHQTGQRAGRLCRSTMTVSRLALWASSWSARASENGSAWPTAGSTCGCFSSRGRLRLPARVRAPTRTRRDLPRGRVGRRGQCAVLANAPYAHARMHRRAHASQQAREPMSMRGAIPSLLDTSFGRRFVQMPYAAAQRASRCVWRPRMLVGKRAHARGCMPGLPVQGSGFRA